jgi:putative tryptophan/tyrosine transport system substrate-binding protein
LAHSTSGLRTSSRYADDDFAKMCSRGHVPVGRLRLIEAEYFIEHRAACNASVAPLLDAKMTSGETVPIVFANVTDPVAAGFVESLARPGCHWFRPVGIREGTNPAGIGQFAAIQSVAPSHGVQVSSVVVRDGSEIERAVGTLAGSPNSGLIVTASGLRDSDGHLIVTLAARYRLPAVYPFAFFVTDGGLISYGPSSTDQYRRAAQYVDRILKGAKPSELPVQAPNKYELVVNLKTAKALGLDLPAPVLARADEVIE